MATTSLTLEERVAALEAGMEQLKRERSTTPAVTASATMSRKPWWERRFGAFKDYPMYEEAMRLGAEYRRSQPTPADEDAHGVSA